MNKQSAPRSDDNKLTRAGCGIKLLPNSNIADNTSGSHTGLGACLPIGDPYKLKLSVMPADDARSTLQ